MTYLVLEKLLATLKALLLHIEAIITHIKDVLSNLKASSPCIFYFGLNILLCWALTDIQLWSFVFTSHLL